MPDQGGHKFRQAAHIRTEVFRNTIARGINVCRDDIAVIENPLCLGGIEIVLILPGGILEYDSCIGRDLPDDAVR